MKITFKFLVTRGWLLLKPTRRVVERGDCTHPLERGEWRGLTQLEYLKKIAVLTFHPTFCLVYKHLILFLSLKLKIVIISWTTWYWWPRNVISFGISCVYSSLHVDMYRTKVLMLCWQMRTLCTPFVPKIVTILQKVKFKFWHLAWHEMEFQLDLSLIIWWIHWRLS